MAKKQQYADIGTYEAKLPRVMERLGVEKYEYDWTRNTAYVQFMYKGQWYRFDHSVDKINATGKMHLTYGTDVFAQLVLALEDLARMVERGIYDLGVWVSGMLYLPQVKELPDCFKYMGYSGTDMPSKEDVEARYKNLVKKAHPDNGGSTEKFNLLQENMRKCMDILINTDN